MISPRKFASREEMLRSGWVFSDGTTKCNRCGVEIQWAKTRAGKNIPVNADSPVVHFDTCSQRPTPTPARAPAPAAAQNSSPAQPKASFPAAKPVAPKLNDALSILAVAVRQLSRSLDALADSREKRF